MSNGSSADGLPDSVLAPCVKMFSKPKKHLKMKKHNFMLSLFQKINKNSFQEFKR